MNLWAAFRGGDLIGIRDVPLEMLFEEAAWRKVEDAVLGRAEKPPAIG